MSFNFMGTVTICSDFRAQEKKVCDCFHFFPFYLSSNDGNKMPWSSLFECWVLSQLFHSPLSPLSRGYCSSSLVSAIRVVSSAYLRLLIILSVILIPACDSSSIHSSSTSFLMMYSAYKLNKQGDNTQPWYTLFPILNKSVVPCPVLTVVILFLIYNY